MKRALIITMDKFPKGDAGATRQEVLAKLLIMCGCQVDVIGFGICTDFKFLTYDEGIRYVSYRGVQKNILDRIYDRMAFSRRVQRYLQSNEAYDVILVISIPHTLIRYLKNYKVLYDTILIHDSVEWYSPSEFNARIFSPTYIEKNRMNTKWIDSNYRVIGISTFLTEHFRRRGCIAERIPFIYDTKSLTPRKECSENYITFMYAGQIGKKDHIRPFLEAVARLNDKDKQRIKIELFGPTSKYLMSTGNVDNKLLKSLDGNLCIHGHVPRTVVESNLVHADFTILFRNSKERYARAGFPTKLVESMSHATPVFCNLSSDMGMYLRDGENCIISTSESEDDVLDGLRRILSLTREEMSVLQKKARYTAMEHFDYRHYKEKMEALLRRS